MSPRFTVSPGADEHPHDGRRHRRRSAIRGARRARERPRLARARTTPPVDEDPARVAADGHATTRSRPSDVSHGAVAVRATDGDRSPSSTRIRPSSPTAIASAVASRERHGSRHRQRPQPGSVVHGSASAPCRAASVPRSRAASAAATSARAARRRSRELVAVLVEEAACRPRRRGTPGARAA